MKFYKKPFPQGGLFHHAALLGWLLTSLFLFPFVALAIGWPSSYTGSLSDPRAECTVTLLSNGQVLAAGGWQQNPLPTGSFSLKSAEVYDSQSGKWDSVADMSVERLYHTATLLPNGKVLVVGGYHVTTGGDASCELYDPASKSWSSAASLNYPRYRHTATLLPNGQVLVAGGTATLGPPISTTAELYDPLYDTWTLSSNTTSYEHYGDTATLLNNGKVLFAQTTGSELYDPAMDTWTLVGGAPGPWAGCATPLANGQVVITGGYYNGPGAPPNNNFSSIYDPSTNSWSWQDGFLSPRFGHTAILGADGYIYVMGGQSPTAPGFAPTINFQYSSTGANWFGGFGMYAYSPRYAAPAIMLNNGKILTVGGNDWSNGGSLATCEILNTGYQNVATASTITGVRYLHASSLLPNGKVLVTGGYNGTGSITSAQLYNPITDSWSSTSALSVSRYLHTSNLLPTGKVLVAGGYNTSSGPLTSCVLYDPSSGNWSTAASLGAARYGHTTTMLADGTALVACGYNGSSYLATAATYSASSNSWTATSNNVGTARRYHTSVLLNNGKVLVAGGYNGSVLTSAQLYDPSTNSWSATGSLNTARYLHTAILLPNGMVLVAGGHGTSTTILSSAELYDPTTGNWSSAASLANARYTHKATLLATGDVVVSGGSSGSAALDSTEVYDPSTDTWTTGPTLASGRGYHTATLLTNGRVLLSAGQATSGILSSAEPVDTFTGYNATAPAISTVSSTVSLSSGNGLALTGTTFAGIDVSGNGSQGGCTNHPVVQIQHVESGQTMTLSSDSTIDWTDTSVTTVAPGSFPLGHAMVTVFTNGTQSTSSIIQITQ